MSYRRKLYLPDLPENVMVDVIAELHDVEPAPDHTPSQADPELEELMDEMIA